MIDESNISKYIARKSGPEVIKPFFMLNSADHEIYPAHKC